MVLIKTGTKEEVISIQGDSGMWLGKMKQRGEFLEIDKYKVRKKNGRKYNKKIPRDYNTYINSDFWKERKNRFFKQNQRKCQICGVTRDIDVHHVIYSKRGFEKDRHLAAVCRYHHKNFHKKYGTKKDMHLEWLKYLEECKLAVC